METGKIAANVTFRKLESVCRHNTDFEDIKCNPICTLMNPELTEPGPHTYTGKEPLCNEENCPVLKTKNTPGTYVIRYSCYNCGFTFKREIQKGLLAENRGGECPMCGIKPTLCGEDHNVLGHC